MKKVILLSLMVLLLPLVFAVNLTNSSIEATGSNTNITIAAGTYIYFDTLSVEANGIYFDGLRLSSGATETVEFNLTESNALYVVNTTQYQLPYLILGLTSVTINNSFSDDINYSLTFPFTCTAINNYSVTNAESLDNFVCSSNMVAIDVINAENGLVVLDFTYSSAQTCNTLIGGFEDVGDLLALFLLGVILMTFGNIYRGMRKGVGELAKYTQDGVLAGVVFGMGLVILVNICL